MTLGLVGLIALLTGVACGGLLIVTSCLRVLLRTWTTRPHGLDDTLNEQKTRMSQLELDYTDLTKRYRKQHSAEMRAAQRGKKAEEPEPTPATPPKRFATEVGSETTGPPASANGAAGVPVDRDSEKRRLLQNFTGRLT